MKKYLVVLCVLFSTVRCQVNDDLNEQIKNFFTTPNTDFLNNFGVVVSDKPLETLGAIRKCGEGEDQGVHVCVPYYNCDGKTRTIIQTGETDGFGVIDIRFGESPCSHPLDVCCKIPKDGVPPSVTTQSPTTKEPGATSPIPPIKPGRGNFCGIRNPNGIDFKITGNQDNEAEYGEFPWVIAILKKNYNPAKDKSLAICGGSLITPGVILTGAHCVNKYKVDELIVRAGEWDTQTTRERVPYQERDIKDIIIHNEFHEQTLFNNVALLILAKPITKADNVGTICLPPQGITFNSKHCFGTGWGKDKFGKEGQYQVILKKIELPTVPFDKCQDDLRKTRLGGFFNLHGTFMCAGGESGKDTCTGDGGSPLVCPDPDKPSRYYQAGLVAWGIGCGQENVPGVYTDLTKFKEWVDEEMAKLNLDTKPYSI